MVSRLCKLLTWFMLSSQAVLTSSTHSNLVRLILQLPKSILYAMLEPNITLALSDSTLPLIVGYQQGVGFWYYLWFQFFSVSSCIFIHMLYKYGTINQHLFYWLISLGSINFSHWVALSSCQYWPLHPGRLRSSSIEWLQIRYHFLYEKSPKGNIKLLIKLRAQ